MVSGGNRQTEKGLKRIAESELHWICNTHLHITKSKRYQFFFVLRTQFFLFNVVNTATFFYGLATTA